MLGDEDSQECPGPIFCLLLGVSSDYAQPITGQVTEVTCPVIGQAQPELTPSKRQKTAVFEIAWWTGARDQQKQCRSSKTPVYAGPKDQQLVLFF